MKKKLFRLTSLTLAILMGVTTMLITPVSVLAEPEPSSGSEVQIIENSDISTPESTSGVSADTEESEPAPEQEIPAAPEQAEESETVNTNDEPVNVALNKTASSSVGANADKGNDGNKSVNGPFSGGLNPSGLPMWWKVDFGDVFDISQTKLYFKPGDKNNWKYKIEYSTEENPEAGDPSWKVFGNADYTETEHESTPDAPHTEEPASAVAARHMRVTLTAQGVGLGGWPTFAEFEAYGVASTEKSVTVGSQSGKLNAGEAGAVTFDVTTKNIADGEYDAAVTGLPTGVTVGNNGKITISGNTGKLKLEGDTSTTVSEISSLKLTIDTAESREFTLKITSPVGVVTIQDGDMSVELDDKFPGVIGYNLDGEVFYGRGHNEAANKVNLGVVTDYSHTSQKNTQRPPNTGMSGNAEPVWTTCTPAVELKDQTASSVTYRLTFSETNVEGVVIDLVYTVAGNVLEMKTKIVTDPDKRVRFFELPENAMISVRGAEDQVTYNSNYNNLDAYGKVSTLELHIPYSQKGGSLGNVADHWLTTSASKVNKLKIGHVMLNTDKLAATLDAGITAEYNYIETKGSGTGKEVNVRPIDFMLRGPDGAPCVESWVKVVVTGDANNDSKINWQDAAIAYRDIMDPMTGENLARQTIAVDILHNYYGVQAWTWENALDYIKKRSLATDNFPQIVLLKAGHRQYGDGHPNFDDGNTLLGGNVGLQWLTNEAKGLNTSMGVHLGLNEIYQESIYYEGMPIRSKGAWDFVDRYGAQIAYDMAFREDTQYSSEAIKPNNYKSIFDYLYDRLDRMYPEMKFHYLDVSTGNTSGYEARWTGMKTVETFRDKNWAFFTEFPHNIVQYEPNNRADTIAYQPRYNNWNHTYYFRNDGEEAGERNGGSDIRRFIVNDLTIYGSGSRNLQNILGPGYYKGYGMLGWHEHTNSDNNTLGDAVNEFWEHILPDTYLKNFPLTNLDMENNTALFEKGVKSVYNPATKARTISRDGVVYGIIDNRDENFKKRRNVSLYNPKPDWINSELFMPWDPITEDKIYVYSTSGDKTWELPKSWQTAGVSSVTLYKLDDTKGRIKVATYDVSNGKDVTLDGLEAKTGYVLYKEEVTQQPMEWGARPEKYAGPSTDQAASIDTNDMDYQKTYKNPQIKDINFNSGDVNYAWEIASGSAGDVKVLNDKTPANRIESSNTGGYLPKYFDNSYLRIDNKASVKQTITDLTPGKQYMASVRVWNEGTYETLGNAQLKRKAFASVDTGSKTVTSKSTGYNSKVYEHYGFHSMTNWGIIKVYFTAENETAVLNIGTEDGTGAVMFDDIRLYQEDTPYGKDGHYFKEDFETTSMMGAFVHENGAVARLAWANPSKFDPGKYLYKEQQVSDATSVMLGGKSNSTKIKTQPSILKLEPNTGYDMSFVYKANGAPAEGAHYIITSPSTGKTIVSRYLTGGSSTLFTEKISFKTDDAEDYIIVFDNKFHCSNFPKPADLFIDDLTLDINPDAVNDPIQPEPEIEAKSLIEAEKAMLSSDMAAGAHIVDDPKASGGKAIQRWQLTDTINFGPLAATDSFRIRYKSTGNSKMDLYLKGEFAATLDFENTDGNYVDKNFKYNIEEMDYLLLMAKSEATNLTLDLLSVSPLYEAESAVYAGNGFNAGTTTFDKASGTIVYLGAESAPPYGTLTFDIKHSATDVVIRHFNDKAYNRLADIYLNDELIFDDYVFKPTPGAGSTRDYEDIKLELPLNPGDKLKFAVDPDADKAHGGDHGPMIDFIMLETDQSKIANSVSVNKTKLEFNGPETNEKLIAAVKPETAIAKKVKWHSSDTDVATVDSNGVVWPVSPGTADIVATLNGGVATATCKVTVNRAPYNNGLTNIALHKKAFANTGTSANLGNDGDYSTGGINTNQGASVGTGKYFKVDLGDVYDIYETRFFNKSGDRNDWFYKIEYSADTNSPADTVNAEGWNLLADYTSTAHASTPGSPHTETLETPAKARWVRIWISAPPAGTGYWCNVYEFEVMGLSNEQANAASFKPVYQAQWVEGTDEMSGSGTKSHENGANGNNGKHNDSTITFDDGQNPETTLAFWQVDLGAHYNISETRLHFKPGAANGWKYTIEYSDVDKQPAEPTGQSVANPEGETWKVLADYSTTAHADTRNGTHPSSKPHIEKLAEPVTARYIRVVFNKPGYPEGLTNLAGNIMGFVEFEAFGSRVTPPSSKAGIAKIAGKNITSWGGGNGSKETEAITATIPVTDDINSISANDLVTEDSALSIIYTDATYTTKAESITLNKNGYTNLYVKAIAENGNVVFYDLKIASNITGAQIELEKLTSLSIGTVKVVVNASKTEVETAIAAQAANVPGFDSTNYSVAFTATGTPNTATAGSMSVAGKFTVTSKASASETAQSTQDVEIKAEVSSTVKPPVSVTGVKLSPEAKTLNVKDTLQLNASVIPADAANKSLEWSSSDAKVATVSSSGLVEAVSPGKATITVKTSDGGKTANCAITVSPIKAEKVTLNMASKDLKKGKSVQLKATVSPDNTTDKSVVWKSSNTKVAVVSPTGKVTAKKDGRATITATSGGKKATCAIRVSGKYTQVSSVKLDKKSISLNVKGTYKLNAALKPAKASNKKLIWESSDTKVATVSKNGTVTAKGEGKAVIKVSSHESGKTASCTVTVKQAVQKVTLSKTSATLKPKKSLKLKATVLPKEAGNTTIQWKSSKPKVAKVSSSGKVVAVSKGSATITAVVGNKKATCKIIVK